MDTITSSREIDALFKHGRRAADPLIMLLCSPTPTHRTPSGRVVFVAGKKLGGAVTRNRCKRLMRAACRQQGGPWPGLDIALIARPDTAAATSGEVGAALGRTLLRLGIVP